jgi:hypothetical protein
MLKFSTKKKKKNLEIIFLKENKESDGNIWEYIICRNDILKIN